MKRFALFVAAMTFGSSASAAGIDSRTYTCAGLQSLIAASRFVFINNPGFGDFAVAGVAYCSGSEFIERRSVPTSDTPECLVDYCENSGGGGGN
jgi:hypothetical protein